MKNIIFNTFYFPELRFLYLLPSLSDVCHAMHEENDNIFHTIRTYIGFSIEDLIDNIFFFQIHLFVYLFELISNTTGTIKNHVYSPIIDTNKTVTIYY